MTKKPTRLFSGLLGSSFATLNELPEPPKPPKPKMVKVHFCFSQADGESKPNCSCKQKIPSDRAQDLILNHQADWLLNRNPKTPQLVRCTKAIVIRRIVVDGEVLFALDPPPNRRDKKHERINQLIRDKARRLFQKSFARGSIPQDVLTLNDSEIDSILANPEPFLERYPSLRRKLIPVVEYYFNNILGFCRLSTKRGLYLVDADAGRGDVTLRDGNRLEQISAKHETDVGKVPVANYRGGSYWCEAWDYTTGHDPSREVQDKDEAFASRYESDEWEPGEEEKWLLEDSESD